MVATALFVKLQKVKTYISFFDVLTHRESKLFIFKNDLTPTIAKRQRVMINMVYVIFFRFTGLVKNIKL